MAAKGSRRQDAIPSLKQPGFFMTKRVAKDNGQALGPKQKELRKLLSMLLPLSMSLRNQFTSEAKISSEFTFLATSF